MERDRAGSPDSLGTNDGGDRPRLGQAPSGIALAIGQAASVELHPGLTAEAADRLHGLGYRPRLAVGDGAAGIAARAPYDRILATCAVPAVPPAWIDQLSTGGRIVANLRSELSSSLDTCN